MAWLFGALFLALLTWLLARFALPRASGREARRRLLKSAWPLPVLLLLVGVVGALVAAGFVSQARRQPATRLAALRGGEDAVVVGVVSAEQPIRPLEYAAYEGADGGAGKRGLRVRLEDGEIEVTNDGYRTVAWEPVQVRLEEWIWILEPGDPVAVAGTVYGRRAAGSPTGDGADLALTARLVARGGVEPLHRALRWRATLSFLALPVALFSLGHLAWSGWRLGRRRT